MTNIDYTPLFAGKLSPKHEDNLKQLIRNCNNLYDDRTRYDTEVFPKRNPDVIRNKVISDTIHGYINQFDTKDLVEIVVATYPVLECPITKTIQTISTHKHKDIFFTILDNYLIEKISKSENAKQNATMNKPRLYKYIERLYNERITDNLIFYVSAPVIGCNSFNLEPSAIMGQLATFRGLEIKSIPTLKNNELLICKKDTIGMIFYPFCFYYITSYDDERGGVDYKYISRFHLQETEDFSECYQFITVE